MKKSFQCEAFLCAPIIALFGWQRIQVQATQKASVPAREKTVAGTRRITSD
jgi:hypothetical protein